jgi:cytochrome c oxidase subunit II
MPVAASAQAKQIDDIFNFMMTIATGLFLLVEGIIIIAIIKYRRKKGDNTDGPSIEGNIPLEIFWTAIPTIIVFVLSVYSFEIYNEMGGLDPMASHDHQRIAHHQNPNPNQIALVSERKEIALGLGASPLSEQGKQPLKIDVNGIQYAWIFTYPDTGIVSGEMHVPVDRPVQLNIRAGDVLHAFWMPELRLKQDAIPGRDAELIFTANREGKYPIICAELCGSYHGGMKTMMYVQSTAEYDKWVAENNPNPTEPATESVAINPKQLKDSEYLEPYAQEMGVTTATLAHLHH